MKYRHSFHAGNFADVHKHVTLLALLRSLQKKAKGFLYLDTHAGRGSYDLSSPSVEAQGGVQRLLAAKYDAAELADYTSLLLRLREPAGRSHLYPGSPLIAAAVLRAQDRALMVELNGAEAHALDEALQGLPGAAVRAAHTRVERGDGFERMKAFLPPPERRGITLIDPPYEAPEDFVRVGEALREALRRFPTGVIAAWYPIKEQRKTATWVSQCSAGLSAAMLVSELWLYPRDARVALNGSGVLIVNPPWQMLERMRVWLPQLQACLAVGDSGGSSARLAGAAA
jgi:23S rRNA (adenine2030-N6)-methyltransferase